MTQPEHHNIILAPSLLPSHPLHGVVQGAHHGGVEVPSLVFVFTNILLVAVWDLLHHLSQVILIIVYLEWFMNSLEGKICEPWLTISFLIIFLVVLKYCFGPINKEVCGVFTINLWP